jgi:hypothetical protein
MKGVEMSRKKPKKPKSVCFGIKNQLESLSFEAIGGAPLVLGYVLINSPSHIKRNLGFYPL